MTNRLPRFAAARGVALAAASTLLVVAACETALPSGPELDAMDVAEVETRLAALGVLTEGKPVTYVLDGIIVQPDVVADLAPERIASIRIVGRAENGIPAVNITTTEAAARRAAIERAADDAEAATILPLMRDGSIGDARADREARVRVALTQDALREREERSTALQRSDGIRMTADFDGILTVNGERVPPSTMARLSPSDIEAIEIVKGPAAARLFSDAAAANGVIQITLKPGARLP